ncbi:hypothetical protein [Phormidium sp. CCY1219]|nr:hypothetical protein [Phormidium sp. CCY1219]MEB3828772.1 hypothetical protein [Phormidium sp. CCY1219]
MGGNRRGEKKGDIIDLVRSHGTEMTQINPTEGERGTGNGEQRSFF